MKKIGIMTFYIPNYGSVLQGYASKTFLQKNGYEAVMLDSDRLGVSDEELAEAGNRHPECIEIYQNFLKSLTGNAAIVSEKSLACLADFIKEELSPEAHSIPELERIAATDEFAAFIIGSDQVWNVSLGIITKQFFLLFAPPEKRIPLCPSFGAGQIHEFLKEDLAEVLKQYERLSVREEDGVRIIKELTGRDAVRLADPTILLTPDEWREFAGVSPDDEKGYLLLHFLNAPNKIAVKNIRYLAETTGMPVRAFSTGYPEYEAIEGVEHIDGGPRDYVRIIANAGLVCTDSFHTTMFSINLDTDFYAFDRQYVHGVSEISRFTTLLNRYNLNERMILDEDFVPDPDHLKITKDRSSIRDEERNTAKNYLLQAIQDTVNSAE